MAEMPTKEVISTLLHQDMRIVPGRGKGSHTWLQSLDGTRHTCVPHSKSISIGLLKQIEKQTGVNLTKRR